MNKICLHRRRGSNFPLNQLLLFEELPLRTEQKSRTCTREGRQRRQVRLTRGTRASVSPGCPLILRGTRGICPGNTSVSGHFWEMPIDQNSQSSTIMFLSRSSGWQGLNLLSLTLGSLLASALPPVAVRIATIGLVSPVRQKELQKLHKTLERGRWARARKALRIRVSAHRLRLTNLWLLVRRDSWEDHVWTVILKWITNKDLPYSTWNSAQRYVAAWIGGEFGGEGYTYMYGWVPLLSTWNYHNIVNRFYPNTK